MNDSTIKALWYLKGAQQILTAFQNHDEIVFTSDMAFVLSQAVKRGVELIEKDA